MTRLSHALCQMSIAAGLADCRTLSRTITTTSSWPPFGGWQLRAVALHIQERACLQQSSSAPSH